MSQNQEQSQTTVATAKHELFEKLSSYCSPADLGQVREACRLAETAHQSQKRKSGEPFIIHPLAVAGTLADFHLEASTIVAGILHDVPEDTSVSLEEIRKQFGTEVAQLVDGVTKLSQIRLKKNWQDVYHQTQTYHSGENFEAFNQHVETLQKMFVAMSQDMRVILIKLADRLHNMETLQSLPAEKKQRISQETLEVYAPLADRLGMGSIKGQLQDLAFPIALPDEYQWLQSLVGPEYAKAARSVERIRRVLLKRLAANGIRAEAHARAKHRYSLWKKLVHHDRDLEKIFDLVATRVIVPTIEDCYRVLGLIHAMWKPLPGRIKDYIAIPKPNGYQSLHTTVFALGGKIAEIQIRTPAMHHWAEFGIAAHWAYKDNQSFTSRLRTVFRPSPLQTTRLTWIQELAKLQTAIHDPIEWRKGIRLDFFEDRIFVFTPIGDVLDLPQEATPIDFAYAVHSDLGNHCIGAKVNGRLVPLSHPLQNGDIVEIITSKKTRPKQDWLQITKTQKAQAHIRRHLSQNRLLRQGKSP